MIHNIDSDNDEELQRAIHLSREDAQYAQRIRQQCGQYEHGVAPLSNNQAVTDHGAPSSQRITVTTSLR
jgi:hypothetical protein